MGEYGKLFLFYQLEGAYASQMLRIVVTLHVDKQLTA